ncbi:MAG: biotin--[acetyl-CoA-carboxylase] ligase, partial [Gemmatimonadetes bacterium]|nr:biotin--[acetyl-CoA-carboxylase] ligase [Gemmatimonadota bacterium]
MNFLPPEWHDQLASTNTHLLERLYRGEKLSSGFVIAAREQTAGRGRYRRQWIAQANENLTFSFLLITRAAFSQLTSLPIAIALGVSDALKTYGMSAQTKWPNDVLIDGAKICGMLLERSDQKQPDGTAIVIGIGLNVNMDATTAALIDRPVTSMRLETGWEYDLEQVLEQVLSSTVPWIDRWESEGFPALRTAWEHRCVYMGEEISVGEGDDVKTGILAGFGDCGQLLLREPDGQVSEIWAGDVAAV